MTLVPNPVPDHESTDAPALGDERSHFLAHMGHDLRTPLTNILALSDALGDGVYGPLNVQQSEALRHIRDNGQRMINMVSDLVDLARFETGKLQLERTACEIMAPCREALDLVRGLARSKQVTLSCEIPPGDVAAVADARRIRQVAAGLVVGAVASAPSEGVVVLRVESRAADGRLWMQAIASKRADGTNPSENSTRDAAASDAALHRLRKMSTVTVALVEQIVRLHDGTFAVSERPGGGVAITASLPLEFAGDAAAGTPGSAPDGQAPLPSAAATMPLILLADDEEIIRSITQDYLESVGYRVVCATNGQEALDLIETETPDLVIMDVHMPVLDGMDAMQRMRGSSNLRIAKLPVISLSGLATPGHRERCLAAGASFCLAKPFGIKDLERAITQTLGQRV